jgi:hypothetical protein
VECPATSAATPKVKALESGRHAARTRERIATSARLGLCRSATQEELQPILIVDLALLGIGEDFVGLRTFFEFLGSLIVIGVLVGVPL